MPASLSQIACTPSLLITCFISLWIAFLLSSRPTVKKHSTTADISRYREKPPWEKLGGTK